MDEKKIQLLTDRFASELWPINKQGNHAIALSELLRAIKNELTVDMKSVTFDLIKTKYTEHIAYIKAINDSRDPQFHTKPELISFFIQKRRYNEDFILSTSQTLDHYLYGD